MGIFWTQYQDNLLKEIFVNNSKKIIMEKLSLSWNSIQSRAIRLGLKRNPEIIHKDRINRKLRCDGLSIEERNLLKEIYENNSKKFILSKIHRTWYLICKTAIHLGLHRSKILVNEDRKQRKKRYGWPEPELNLLRNIYENNFKKDILSQFQKNNFNRSWQSIKHTAKNLGLVRNKDIIKKEIIENSKKGIIKLNLWTPEENELLKQIYENNTQELILNNFPNRSWKSLREQAIKLNLCRTKTIIRQDTSKATKKSLLEKYGVDCSFLIPEIKAKIKQNNLKKYGTDHHLKSKTIRDKINNTVKERYGVDNIFQLESIKDKIATTNIKKYGFKNPQQNQAIHEQTKKTHLKKYGVEIPFQRKEQIKATMLRKWGKESPLQIPEIKQKMFATNIAKYGFPVSIQNKEISEKVKRTNNARFGNDFPFQNKEIQNKTKETLFNNYNVYNPMHSEIIKSRMKKNCLEKYGVEYSLQSKEVREKGYITSKKNKSFSKSLEENNFLSYLKIIDSKTEHHVKHPILGNVIDFFMPEYNIWVQYDGIYWHGKIKRKNCSRHTLKIQKTIERDKYQNEHIPNLIRFWSDDVLKAIKNNTILDLIKKTLSITLVKQYNSLSEPTLANTYHITS